MSSFGFSWDVCRVCLNAHLSSIQKSINYVSIFASVVFYLEDFILQHRQLVGIPCYEVVANFGIFASAGHPIVRPVNTHGILSSRFVFVGERDSKVCEGLNYLPIWWGWGLSVIKLKKQKDGLLHFQVFGPVMVSTFRAGGSQTKLILHQLVMLVFCNWGWWEKAVALWVPLFPRGPSWRAPPAAPSHSETLDNKVEHTDP